MSWTAELTDDGVHTLTLDDGAKNALRLETFQELVRLLDEAPEEARAVVVAGREGIFSAGLDLNVLLGSTLEQVREIIVAFGTATMRLWTEPRPTVCAATGHAVAGGTVLAMACDHAIAAEGEWAWGLTETQIDLEIPSFIMELARANVRVDRLQDLLIPGVRLQAAAAVEVGYADELAPADEVVARAHAKAVELAALPPRAYGRTKARFRQQVADEVMAGLVAEVTDVTAHLGQQS